MTNEFVETRHPRPAKKAQTAGPARHADGPTRASRGIQSIEVGGLLLQALVREGRAMALKDLARAAGMAPAKAHPYLVSFGKIGLIEQRGDSGHYGLGALAVQLGLIGLQQVDPVRLASAELPGLAQRIGHTVAIAVWGLQGPTIVRIESGPAPIHVSMRHGSTVSVRGTASGKLFAALGGPLRELAALLRGEAPASAARAKAFDAELASIRERGISVSADEIVVGVSAVAAPVFDAFGRLALALTVIGPTALLDTGIDGACVVELRLAAQMLSRRLGAPQRLADADAP